MPAVTLEMEKARGFSISDIQAHDFSISDIKVSKPHPHGRGLSKSVRHNLEEHTTSKCHHTPLLDLKLWCKQNVAEPTLLKNVQYVITMYFCLAIFDFITLGSIKGPAALPWGRVVVLPCTYIQCIENILYKLLKYIMLVYPFMYLNPCMTDTFNLTYGHHGHSSDLKILITAVLT